MSDRKKRKMDVEEITVEKSNDILNLLNDEFPELYIAYQLAAFFKANPIPTTPDIFESYKNTPGKLIMDFFNYIDFNIKKYMNDKLCTIITNDGIDFLNYVNGNFNHGGSIDLSPILITDKYGYIHICPYTFLKCLPNKPDQKTYNDGINSMDDYKFILIKILNLVFSKFNNEMKQKYNINVNVTAEDNDYILISIEF